MALFIDDDDDNDVDKKTIVIRNGSYILFMMGNSE